MVYSSYPLVESRGIQCGMHWAQRRHPQRLVPTSTRPHGVSRLLAFFDVHPDQLLRYFFQRKRWQETFRALKCLPNIISNEHKSSMFWTTSRPISVQRHDAGCERTIFTLSRRRPLFHDSTQWMRSVGLIRLAIHPKLDLQQSSSTVIPLAALGQASTFSLQSPALREVLMFQLERFKAEGARNLS